MNNDTPDPLQNIVYISLPDEMQSYKLLPIDPSILLPVEINPDSGYSDITNLSWEMIIAAMMKILAHNPSHENAGYYRELIKTLRPDINSEMTNAAIAKAQEKDFDIAEEIFLSLKNLFPEDTTPLLNLALLFEERADSYGSIEHNSLEESYNEKAFSAYKELLALNPELPDSHFNFGLFSLKRSNFDKAAEHLDFFLSHSNDTKRKNRVKDILEQIKHKNNADDLFYSAYDAIRMGKEDEAISKIQEYLKIESDVWNAWFLLGWAYRRKKMYKEGAEAFKKALKLGSDQIDLFNELAICLMELGKLVESREYLLKALKIEPENIKILSNLGIVSMKEENTSAAREYFKSVLMLNPDDKIAADYLTRL